MLLPFSQALSAAADEGLSLADAWRKGEQVARQSAQDTAQLVPKIGRARPLAERSLGTPDAGAISLAMIIAAVGACLADNTEIAPSQENVCP